MGYDFHALGGHLGPLAPIGWLEAVGARVEQLGVGGKFLLGVGNYALGDGWYTSSGDAVTLCGAGYPTTTTHMQTCSYGHQDPGVAPHCNSAKGELWFEDAASMAEKAQLAKRHGLKGIAYYTLGAEPPGWTAAINAAFP
jgi:hypothetical protein